MVWRAQTLQTRLCCDAIKLDMPVQSCSPCPVNDGRLAYPSDRMKIGPVDRKASSMKRTLSMIGSRWRWYPWILIFFALAASCAESKPHDEILAAVRAIEFVQITLIDQNLDNGYERLAAGGKRHVSLDKFKETMTRLHPRGFPQKITAQEYQPMPGENALWIYMIGQNDDEQFQYRLTMQATDTGDYKVLTLDNGMVGRLFSPSSDKRRFEKPLSTTPDFVLKKPTE